MSDLIDRKQAIQNVCEQECNQPGPCKWSCLAIDALKDLPSVIPTPPNTSNTLGALDCIDRQSAIEDAREAFKRNPTMAIRVMDLIKSMPSVQPTQLTDEDKETIRIHLSAIKEGLCNQRRWNEAREYEELITRLLSTSFVIRCKECKHWALGNTTKNYPNPYICELHSFMHGFERSALPEDYCSWAELRGDKE